MGVTPGGVPRSASINLAELNQVMAANGGDENGRLDGGKEEAPQVGVLKAAGAAGRARCLHMKRRWVSASRAFVSRKGWAGSGSGAQMHCLPAPAACASPIHARAAWCNRKGGAGGGLRWCSGCGCLVGRLAAQSQRL
jgi:hypothetical protein